MMCFLCGMLLNCQHADVSRTNAPLMDRHSSAVLHQCWIIVWHVLRCYTSHGSYIIHARCSLCIISEESLHHSHNNRVSMHVRGFGWTLITLAIKKTPQCCVCMMTYFFMINCLSFFKQKHPVLLFLFQL